MSVSENLIKITKELPLGVKLVAVSKTKPAETVLEAYQQGQRLFGENKVQEMVSKYETLPKDIEWHLIGHLQTNKVKYIAPFVSLIHSVDSLKLLKTIDKEAQKNKRVISCLLQFHIANEETKFGLSALEADEMLNSAEYKELENIKVIGVMGMATFTENIEQIRNEFKTLRKNFEMLKEKHFSDDEHFKELSMGMSDDYRIAIEEGSTMVRIGSTIFGHRQYH
jgi:PLP dependent protein